MSFIVYSVKTKTYMRPFLLAQNVIAINMTWRFSPELIWISEADRVGEGRVPEVGD